MYPLEVELALASHPAVKEVVVVRAEDRLRGEAARAVVVLEQGMTATPAELRLHCRGSLASYKLPRYVEIWPEIPHLPGGKIDKKGVAAAPLPGE